MKLLLGFGNVGRRLAEILADRAAYPGLADLDVSVVGITTGSRGGVADPGGLDLRRVLAEHGHFASSLTSQEALQVDGAPVFNLAQRCLQGNTLLKIEGILNSDLSTTAYGVISDLFRLRDLKARRT
jgi:homoserine dehydrogenase